MTSKAKVLLVGSGGIGTITALNLEIGGQASITAVLRSNYDIVMQKGFKIDACDYGSLETWRPTKVLREIPNVVETSNVDPFDFIICTTKNTPDITPSLVDIIRPAVTANHSVIVLVQNGLNIEKPILSAFPTNICLSGVSLMGASEPSPGHVVEDDPDRLYIGEFRNPNINAEKQKAAAQEFVRLYSASEKAQCSYQPDVLFVRWRKLMYNAVWNPICSLVDMDTSRLRLASDSSDHMNIIEILVKPAMNEIRLAAKASANVELPESLVESMIECDPIEIFCAPSMLQDVRKNRFIEFENILGEALREGEAAGVQMPTVKVLYGLCKARQWRTKELQGRVNADELMRSRKEVKG